MKLFEGLAIELKRSNNYPWRIFRRLVISQVIIFNILYFILAVMFFDESLERGLLFKAFLVFFVGTFLVSLLSAYYFCRPVARIMHKVLILSSKKQARDLGPPPESLTDVEVGEYSQIENALDRIDRKIKKNQDRLKREQDVVEALMSSVQDGLVSVDLEGRVLFFNSQFATHFLSTEKVKGDNPIFLSEIFRVPEIFEAFDRVLETGASVRLTINPSDRLVNSPHHYTILMSALRRSETHEIYGVTGVFHDITEIKKSEQIRIDFFGNASHELLTPITTIKGYVETLKDDLRRGQIDGAEKFLDIVSRNVNRLTDLVNDMLQIHKLENQTELKVDLIDLMAISDQVVSDLAVFAGEKGQTIKVSCLCLVLLADRSKVEQVLRNLISNAIKYIPNSRLIQIKWDLVKDNEVQLTVVDNGPGISEHHLSRLFERFYRVDRGRSRELGGTGLGLAIVKHIMQRHGGSVEVKSTLGKGTEFVCTFPNRISEELRSLN